MKILQHNVETGEVSERNATAAEVADVKEKALQGDADRAEIAAKATAKAALLERLGITEEEASLLLA
jgi:hypothetical protein